MGSRVDSSEIVRLSKLGKPASEIARSLGCNPATIHRWRRSLGLSKIAPPDAYRPISARRLEDIASLVADGASQNEIVRTLHVSHKTMRKYFPEAKWSQAEGGRFGLMVRHLNKMLEG